MCEAKSEASSKVDKLISAMDRLSEVLERSLDVELGRNETHVDARGLGGGRVSSDFPSSDLP